MAALQKIRKHGALMVGLVGLALFAFIAEEAVRSFQSTANESRQQVGVVNGEKLSVQDFNTMVDEYADFIKVTRNQSQLDEQTMASIRDDVWQSFVQNTIIGKECEKAGIAVTDAEVQDAISKGNHQLLAQLPFRGQNGQFDVNQLRQFISNYEQAKNDPARNSGEIFEQSTMLYRVWTFVEKRLRSDLLTQKFISVLQSAALSNNIAAQAAFDARTNQWDVLLAAIPFNSIDDASVEVTDKDKQTKYNELKPAFKLDAEQRDIEVISVQVRASEADRAALKQDLDTVAAHIGTETNMAKFVRESASTVPYSSLLISSKAMPRDIAAQIDSMSIGQVVGPFTSPDNTMNVVRLINKVSAPDSIELRQIAVGGADIAAARQTADSIVAAINGGAPFDTIAARYNQQGDKIWLTGAQYEGQAMDDETTKYLKAITEIPAGSLQVVELTGGCYVLNVTDRRNFVNKYDVAIVKRPITFSSDTYNDAYNKLSQFLAENQTAETICENASKKNYRLLPFTIASSAHNIANVSGTREALRWIFNEDTDKEDVSPLYECGENDNLMVVILKNIYKKGYMPATYPDVDAQLAQLVLNDKKAEKIMADVEGKSFEDVAKMQTAVVDTVNHVAFASGVYVPALGTNEPNLAGAFVGKKTGDAVAAVKGQNAVYVAKVLNATKSAETFNEESERVQQTMANANAMLQGLMQDLTEKAKITDNRYLFY